MGKLFNGILSVSLVLMMLSSCGEESCPDDAEFVRRAQRSKTGPVVFYGDRDRVAAYRI